MAAKGAGQTAWAIQNGGGGKRCRAAEPQREHDLRGRRADSAAPAAFAVRPMHRHIAALLGAARLRHPRPDRARGDAAGVSRQLRGGIRRGAAGPQRRRRIWLNIGDGYTSGNRGWRAPDKKNPARAMSMRPDTPAASSRRTCSASPGGWRSRCRTTAGICAPTSSGTSPTPCRRACSDRPTRAHEYVFMLTKSDQYRYDRSAILDANGRNRRSVWDVNTLAYVGAHFATFPPKLVEPCVKASPAGRFRAGSVLRLRDRRAGGERARASLCGDRIAPRIRCARKGAARSGMRPDRESAAELTCRRTCKSALL